MLASRQLCAIECARRGGLLASCFSFSARQNALLPRQRSIPVVTHAAARRSLFTATAAPRILSADAPPAAAPTPSPAQDKIIYVGPANSNIQFIKRLAAGTVICFGVAYPIAAVVLNVGTATYGLGTRLLLSGIGSLFSVGLTTVLHKFTKGYIISISINPGVSLFCTFAFSASGHAFCSLSFLGLFIFPPLITWRLPSLLALCSARAHLAGASLHRVRHGQRGRH
jgi:hypothetical protein